MNFERRGFIIRGLFDCNSRLHGTIIRDIEVQPMEKIKDFVKENDIDIAVLTIPKASAVDVAEQLVQYGIRAIWNFAHVDLNVPEGIQVENVHLSDSLMRLSYNINRYDSELAKKNSAENAWGWDMKQEEVFQKALKGKKIYFQFFHWCNVTVINKKHQIQNPNGIYINTNRIQ